MRNKDSSGRFLSHHTYSRCLVLRQKEADRRRLAAGGYILRTTLETLLGLFVGEGGDLVDLKGAEAGHEALGLGDDDLLKIYHHMLLARRVDERMWTLNRQGKAAFVISCQGQEAAQVGVAYNLRPGRDYVSPYYRDSGISMLLGDAGVPVVRIDVVAAGPE